MSAYLQQQKRSAAGAAAPAPATATAHPGEFIGFDDADSDEADAHDRDDEASDSDSDDNGDGWLQSKQRKSSEHKNSKTQTQTKTLELSDNEKDSEEEGLEQFVLGDNATFRAHLFEDIFLGGFLSAQAQDSTGKELVLAGQENDLENLADGELFAIDVAGSGVKFTAEKSTEEEGISPEDKPAWEDSDDEKLEISLNAQSRSVKLITKLGENHVNGAEYARRLRAQYTRLHPTPAWAIEAEAKSANNKAARRRRRRSSAAGATNSDSSDLQSGSDSDSDDDNIDPSALPLETFLRNAANFTNLDSSSSRKRKLKPETIDIQKTRDIPDTHKAAVASLAFHPSRPILLSASTSSVMYLHQIDDSAHPVPNPLLTSVQVGSTDVRRAEFVGPAGAEIIFAGRRRYFHSWSLSSGRVTKVCQIHGLNPREQRTMENFRASPDGKHLALVSSEKKGGGLVNILNARSMQWVAAARVNGRGGVSDVQWWSDSSGLSILGKDGAVTEYSLLARRAVGVWRDQGSIGGTVLALGGTRGGPKELGGDRWVAVGSISGICNIYERASLLLQGEELEKRKKELAEEGITSSVFGEVEVNERPIPRRVLEQLTTAISLVRFSPDGQVLAFASVHRKDALRLVHLPSCTVYRNWPTENTPLGRVTCVAFGNGGVGDGKAEVLAVGNDRGKIRMWEIRA